MSDKDRIIAELRELVATLTAQLEVQTRRIAELELELAKAKKDSSTSSKSPSSDIVKRSRHKAAKRFMPVAFENTEFAKSFSNLATQLPLRVGDLQSERAVREADPQCLIR
jgi:hypothetical protein